MPPLAPKRRRTLLIFTVVCGFGAAAAFMLLYLKKPGAGSIYPPCPSLWLTGFYCPGCGALRAIHELLHLRFAEALKLNPLVVLSLPPLGFYFLRLAAELSGIIPVSPGKPIRPAYYYAVGGVILGFWLLRNLPFFPFTLLAPH